MSLVSSFESQINEYVNQMADYKDQLSEYKDQLAANAGQASEIAKQIGTEVAVPVGMELVKLGVSKMFGEAAGDAVSKMGSAAVRGALNGETSAEDIIGNMQRSLTDSGESAQAVATESPLADGLAAARQAVSSVVNRVAGGAEEAVASGESALSNAQGALASAFENVTSAVGQRVLGNVSNIVQSAGARISAAANQNNIIGILNRTDSPLDTKVFGDIELSNMADLNVKQAIPDLSLPNELTFQIPGLQEPMAFPGASSNVIGRLLSLKQQGVSEMEQASDLVPGAEEMFSSVTQNLGQLAQGVVGRLGGVAQEAVGQVSGLAGQVLSAAEATTGEAAGSLLGAAGEAAGAAAGEVAGAAAGAAAEAGADIAAGAAGGPVGLVIGGLIGIGTLLYDVFHHSSAPAPPPVQPQLSLPSFQPGLGTME